MKKSMKILCIALCAIIALTPVMFATTIGGVTVNPDTTNQNTVNNLGNKIVGVLKIVGIFVSIGAMIAIGIKYMMGSAEEKAEYKKVLIPYLLGAILVFAASIFAEKLYDIAQNLFN